jgi:hypothetical protein
VSRQRKPEPAEDEHPAPVLRLVKTPESKLKRDEPDPEIRAMFDDIGRQRAEQKRERVGRDPGGKDAA